MAKVKSHKRTVNGRTQTVRTHNRTLRPSRAGANARAAVRHGRRKNYGTAAALGCAAAAEAGGWLLGRGAGLALVTVGLAVPGTGVALRRATAPTPAQARSSQRRSAPPRSRQQPTRLPQATRQPAATGPDRSTRSGFRQRQHDRATPQQKAEQDEFYRLREVEGYKGPVRWDKGQMPRKADEA